MKYITNEIIQLRFVEINKIMAEQQQKIQKYIIKSTPYGQLNEVIHDLEKLSPLNINSPTISSTIEDYNEEHLALFPLKNQPPSYFAVMTQSKIGPGKYLDQLNKKVYTVDHLSGEIVSIEDTELQLIDSVEQLLSQLSQAATQYAAKYYRDPFGASVFMDLSEESLDIYIGITSKNIQLNNFYTGQWVSKWKITKGSIQGNISIKAHFFQSGNVQFNQKKTFKKEFQFQENMTENAKTIIKVIQAFQGELQSHLDVIYEQMPTKFFKKLRMITPFTKTKMVWNINAVKMNKNLLDLNK